MLNPPKLVDTTKDPKYDRETCLPSIDEVFKTQDDAVPEEFGMVFLHLSKFATILKV